MVTLQVLTSPASADPIVQATQAVLYGSSDVAWMQLDDGFHVLKEAWTRQQRRFPVPSSLLAASIRVLSHRLFMRSADTLGWNRESFARASNPFWLKPMAESTLTLSVSSETSAAASSPMTRLSGLALLTRFCLGCFFLFAYSF